MGLPQLTALTVSFSALDPVRACSEKLLQKNVPTAPGTFFDCPVLQVPTSARVQQLHKALLRFDQDSLVSPIFSQVNKQISEDQQIRVAPTAPREQIVMQAIRHFILDSKKHLHDSYDFCDEILTRTSACKETVHYKALHEKEREAIHHSEQELKGCSERLAVMQKECDSLLKKLPSIENLHQKVQGFRHACDAAKTSSHELLIGLIKYQLPIDDGVSFPLELPENKQEQENLATAPEGLAVGYSAQMEARSKEKAAQKSKDIIYNATHRLVQNLKEASKAQKAKIKAERKERERKNLEKQGMEHQQQRQEENAAFSTNL